jgi:hypothetical protein
LAEKINFVLANKGEKSMTKILADDENSNRRLVELEAIHEIDREGSLSLLYTASLTMGGVTLRRISSAEPSTQFYLDMNVMDALVAGWTGFKAAVEARKQEEEEQKQTTIAEAYAIAARHPEIKIKADNETHPRYWEVSIPSQGYGFCSPAYYPDSLLEQVKTCCAVLMGREGDAA